MAPISIQHAKESNFAQFARLIDSMEDRYMNVGSDGIVDINSLQVIRTRSGRVSKPRVSLTPNRSTDKKRKGRSSLYSNTSSSTPLTISSSTSLPVSSSSTPLPASSSQDSSSFEQTQREPQRAITSNLRSILFDRPAQNKASKNLLAILKAGGPMAAKTARNLYERSLIVLGRDDLPNRAKMRPFFTFHEEQDIGVTFLFDTPDYTPWTLICLKFFGEENLDLYQQIYKYVLAEAAMRSRQNDFSMRSINSSVRTPASAKTDYLALMPYVDDPKQMEIDEDDLENLNTQQTHHRTRSSNQVVSAKASPSALSKAYVTASSSMPIYHPSIESIVYQNDAQLSSLRKLAEILRQNDEESRQVKKKLTARAVKALGIESMPYGRNVLPFFTFHEKGEIGVSFLFNIETLSPWTTVCQLYFGSEILEISKEIYRMMNQPRSESLLMLEKLCKFSNAFEMLVLKVDGAKVLLTLLLQAVYFHTLFTSVIIMSITNTTSGLMPMVQSDSKHRLFNVTSIYPQHHDYNHHSIDPQQMAKGHSSQMTSSSIDSMMKNYFHITFGDTVLIKGWNLESATDVFIACAVFFLLAVFYEGLKSLREFLFRREARSGSYRVSLYTPTNACLDDMIATSVNQSDEHPIPNPTLINCSMWSKAHLYQSSLHAIQVTISYTLMLGFMTFNSWICLSILLGAGLGYFLFCWRKLTFVNVTDHCN